MILEPDIAYVASLIGEPARAKMLSALMGGQALTATELSLEAQITAQTASTHLAKLVEGSLITVRKQGRHKYFQLSGHAVAQLLEQMSNLSVQTTSRKFGPADPQLKKSRVCYDHLAGEIAVALYDSLVSANYLIDRGCETILTDSGRNLFQKLGIDAADFSQSNRPFCRSCLDWSERTNHLAGHLGQWILNDILSCGWAEKIPDSRAVIFTDSGLQSMSRHYQVDLALANSEELP